MSNERDYYIQVSESVNSLFELLTRVDERVKHMQAAHEAMQNLQSSQTSSSNEINGRLQVLETKVHSMNGNTTEVLKDKIRSLETKVTIIENVISRSESRWEKIVRWVVQLSWIIVAAWALTELNLQPPQVP